jgi:hypothetical protein
MKSETTKQNLGIQLQPKNQPAVLSVEKPVFFIYKENLSCTSYMLPYINPVFPVKCSTFGILSILLHPPTVSV